MKIFRLGVPGDFLLRLDRALIKYSRVDRGTAPLRERLLKYTKQAKEERTGGAAHKYVLLNEGPRAWEGHSLPQCRYSRSGGSQEDQPGHQSGADSPLACDAPSQALLTPMPLTYTCSRALRKSGRSVR